MRPSQHGRATAARAVRAGAGTRPPGPTGKRQGLSRNPAQPERQTAVVYTLAARDWVETGLPLRLIVDYGTGKMRKAVVHVASRQPRGTSVTLLVVLGSDIGVGHGLPREVRVARRQQEWPRVRCRREGVVMPALPAGSGWWRGLKSPVHPSRLEETGSRTFALKEIMVRQQWRRRGYARTVHDTLLANRSEERASLLVNPHNTVARDAYQSWVWYKLGDLKPFDDSPTYEALLRELPLDSR